VPSRRPAWFSPTSTLALAAIVLLAGALRLHRLGAESAWLDEAFSIDTARAPVTRIIQATADDVHPPLYYLVLHLWLSAVGAGTGAARLLSVVFSLAAIVVVAWFARRELSPATGITAALLLAVSPFQVEFAQEARMYALLTVAAILNMTAFVALLRQDNLRWWIVFVLTAAAMYYAHLHGLFVTAAQGVVILGALLRAPAQHRQAARHWLMACLAAAALFSPWMGPLASQVSRVQGHFWIPAPQWIDAMDPFVTFAGSGLIALVLGAFAMAAVVRWPHATPTGPLVIPALVSWALTATLLPWLISALGAPIFLPKYTITASLPLAMLAAHGITRLPRGIARGAAVVLVVGLTIPWLKRYYREPRKDDWRGAAALVERVAAPSDLILFYPDFNQVAFEYYRTRTDIRLGPVPLYDPEATAERAALLARGAALHDERVWLIVRQGEPLAAAMRQALAHGRVETDHAAVTHLDISRFESTD
jgi:uncharacterized membrane protein